MIWYLSAKMEPVVNSSVRVSRVLVTGISFEEGRGVAQLLLQTVLEEGKKQGHTVAQINMYIGNEPALNLYQKCGFEVIEESRDADFEQTIGSPGMVSLARTL